MNFKTIYKNISILGIGQIVMILFAIGKSKVAAEFLSVEGIGLIFALASTIGIIGTICNFGLGTLATRDVSSLFKNDDNLFLKEISVYRLLAIVSGVLGLLLILLFSNKIGVVTFGNSEYNLYIILLCVMPLLSQYNTSQFAILQATRNFSSLTKSNIFSSFCVLLSAVFLYYYYGEIGVPYVIIASALFPVVFNTIFLGKLNIDRVRISYSTVYERFILLVKRGSFVSFANSLPNVTVYLITIFLIKEEGLITSGLFACAYTITSSFINLIISTLNPEFLSRISSQIDRNNINEHIKDQTKLVVHIISPILIILISSSSLLIRTFYNEDFLVSTSVLILLLSSIVIKTLLWVVNYIYIVMKDEILFFAVELLLSVSIYLLIYLFYPIFNLEAIGFSYLISYSLVIVVSSVLVSIKYRMNLSLNTLWNIAPNILFVFIASYLNFRGREFASSYFLITTFIASAVTSIFYLKKTLSI